MEVEFTARHVKVTKALRTQAADGMDRITRLLGKTVRSSIIFGSERHLQTAEITLLVRQHSIVANGKADTLDAALKQAIDHAANQARRYRDKRLESKRLPKEEKVLAALPVSRPKARAAEPALDASTEANPANAKLSRTKVRTSIAVHSFPNRETIVEPHIVKSSDAISMKPMSIEEAVKDAEFRDRDLVIFRDLAGATFVLHRRRDGQMELVEIA